MHEHYDLLRRIVEHAARAVHADHYAGLAMSHRVEPTMTPDAGRDAYPDRLQDWLDSPLLDGAAGIDDADRRELRETVARLEAYFGSILSPVEGAEIERRAALLRDGAVLDLDGRPLPVAPVEPTMTPARPKTGRPPDTNAEADRHLAEDWRGCDRGTYPTRKAFEDARGLKRGDLKRALDRVAARERKSTV